MKVSKEDKMRKRNEQKRLRAEKKAARHSGDLSFALPAAFLADVKAHIALPRGQSTELLHDFARAFAVYRAAGVSEAEALDRLSPTHLGGFYSHAALLWYPLDTAAKIYPLSMKQGQVPIFRLSVYLTEPVCPEILQMALTFTIKRFPSFATTVKKGFFWHYLDSAKRRFQIEPEQDVPCSPMHLSASGAQSFRVLYYQNRISTEFFHGLTDGSGGMVFLNTLAAEYLRLMGHSISYSENVWNVDDTPQEAETRDDFTRCPPVEKRGGFMGRAAVQMSGRLSRVKPCQTLHFQMDADKLCAVARENGATVTSLVLALMLLAEKFATEEAKGDIRIQVPVNMRKFNDSITVRNYAMYCSVEMKLESVTDLSSILPEVARQLQAGAAQQTMNEMMASALNMTRSLRFIPLAVKAPVARVIYGFLGDAIFSNTLSNLGVVKAPPEMAEYVEKYDFVLGTANVSRAVCSMATYKNVAVLSIAKQTRDPSFEEKLYELFASLGLTPKVTGSALYEG